MPSVRMAGKADIPLLVRHHSMMFEEIRALQQKPVLSEKLVAMDICYRQKLDRQTGTPGFAAWIAVEDETVAGSVCVSIISMVPVPEDPQDRVAYLHSLFVEAAFRGNGIARSLVQKAADHCRAVGIVRVQLVASAAGRPLYESMGFSAVPESMMLRL